MHCWFQSIIEINLTTFNSLFCSTVDITLTIRMFKTSYVCSFHFCDLFFRTLIYFRYMNFDDWLPKTVVFSQISFWYKNNHITSLKSKYIFFRFSRGVYTSLFMKHKRMLFLCVWIESQISYLLLLSVPKNMDELKNKVQDIPQKLAQSVGEVTEKCSLQ